MRGQKDYDSDYKSFKNLGHKYEEKSKGFLLEEKVLERMYNNNELWEEGWKASLGNERGGSLLEGFTREDEIQ